MRIVVIGATGNVGSAVLRELCVQPSVTEITGVARRLPSRSLPKVGWQAADILTADLEAIFAGADVVIHLAWAIQPARDRALTRAIDVDGSTRVFRAAAQARVARLVHASSVGVYSPGPHDQRVDEQWPREGVSSSFYSRDKADAEHALDAVEQQFPELRVVRLRPGIVMQRSAAQEIRRLFLGPFVPARLLRRELIAAMPDVAGVAFQAVHADDLARAYRLAALHPDARGAYNVAAELPLDTRAIAQRLRAFPIPVPAALARAATALTWRLRLQPTPPGWLDLGLHAPLMSTKRVRDQLGWHEERSALQALDDLLEGLRDGAGDNTPPLAAGDRAPGRAHEIATGLGARP